VVLSASLITLHTFRFGARYGRCSRAPSRGLEMRALDGVNTESLAGFGFELNSFFLFFFFFPTFF
jgi:hypothetical protein